MPKQPSARPRRYIVIPPPGLVTTAPARHTSGRAGSMPTTAPGGQYFRAGGAGRTDGPGRRSALGLKVVNRSSPDGAVLVEGTHVSKAQLEARVPAGAVVVEERWYSLSRPALPWRKLSATLKAPRTAGRAMAWTVTAVLDEAGRPRLKDALVTVLIDAAKGIGVEAVTDRFGRVTVELGAKTTRIDAIYVSPLHGGWPVALHDVDIAPPGMEVAVPPLDLAAPDVRGLVYGKAAVAGRGVKVAVIDTGVGPHTALTLAGGRNTTGEPVRRWHDEDGHGSHVAGVIAANAAGWRRGEASRVALQAYRIFKAGDCYASNYAISAAILQAAVDGCDLVNLSIGGGGEDELIRQAVDTAWSMGCVCLAAAGNDGLGEVDFPARYPKVLAVSAIGLEDSWPAGAGAGMAWTLGTARGKSLAGRQSFLASFSNRGPKVALTAPGVAVVSTLFGDRWGVMSGTSMASPVATGVVARRLAASPVFKMPRDEARAAAILKLALDPAEDLGLPSHMQGAGMAR